MHLLLEAAVVLGHICKQKKTCEVSVFASAFDVLERAEGAERCRPKTKIL